MKETRKRRRLSLPLPLFKGPYRKLNYSPRKRGRKVLGGRLQKGDAYLSVVHRVLPLNALAAKRPFIFGRISTSTAQRESRKGGNNRKLLLFRRLPLFLPVARRRQFLLQIPAVEFSSSKSNFSTEAQKTN